MKQFSNILWVFNPDDGKAPLEWVTNLAKAPQAQLTVVQVMDRVPPGLRSSRRFALIHDCSDLQRLFIERERMYLEQSVDTLRAQGLHPQVRVLSGVPFLEITRQVLRAAHDLVIVSAKGNFGVGERMPESPTLHLMRTCPCPLWVVKPVQGEPRSGILAALDAEEKEHEELNQRVLDIAYSLAQWKNSEIHVLHPRPMNEQSLPRGHVSCDRSSRQLASVSCLQEQKRLDPRCAEYRLASCTKHYYYLRGAAASLICRLAHDRPVDVIVMGTACRPGGTECVQGDIAETVLHQVDCSVLSVKSESFVSPVSV